MHPDGTVRRGAFVGGRVGQDAGFNYSLDCMEGCIGLSDIGLPELVIALSARAKLADA